MAIRNVVSAVIISRRWISASNPHYKYRVEFLYRIMGSRLTPFRTKKKIIWVTDEQGYHKFGYGWNIMKEYFEEETSAAQAA
jgi:hypothetical protein